MIKHFDVTVIGGGAAGLFFTAQASQMYKKLNFAIIEKNQRVGKKLLVTGNGRCNLTNIYTKAENYHGSFEPYIDEVLFKCSPEKIIDLFLKMGLVTRVDDCGRVYPKSNQSSSVLDVLRFNCENSNVSFFCENKVIDVKKNKGLFTITTDNETITTDKLIFATGGAAAPKSGGDKSGYELLKKFGHTINKISPSLCPINVKSEFLKSLKGIRVQGEISLFADGKHISSEIGEIQFTDNALSGICVFNLSQYFAENKKQILRIKLMPENNFSETLDILINNQNVFSEQTSENLMTGIFHKRIAQALLKSANISLNKKVSEISNSELKSLAKLINSFDFEATHLGGLSLSQVTKGGVKGDEVDPLTFESKKTKGLYIIGEALDCNGDCGGYNLQFAFATGYLAAKSL